MITCKYCGTELDFIGEKESKQFFHCNYCDISFEKQETCYDRKRKASVPPHYDSNYYQPTNQLLKLNTVELFHLLSDCRKDWFTNYSTLQSLKKLKNDDPSKTKQVDEMYKPLNHEYIKMSKQKFIIENILLEKAGFLPEKITNEFLSMLVEEGTKSSQKPMYIYVK